MVGEKLEMYKDALGVFFTLGDEVLFEDYGGIFKGTLTKVTDSCFIITGNRYRQVYRNLAKEKIVLFKKGKYHDRASDYRKTKESSANRRS